MTEPTERDLFLAHKILERAIKDEFVPMLDIATVIATAREEGRREERARWEAYLAQFDTKIEPNSRNTVDIVSATVSHLPDDTQGVPLPNPPKNAQG